MKPIIALAVSHKDVQQAKLWLRWAGYLSSLHSLESVPLVVAVTRSISRVDQDDLAAILRAWPKLGQPTIVRLPDEDERGYPGSASHLFARTLQLCAKHHPKRPILFCEADTAPMSPDWYDRIAADYARLGQPFMGRLIPSTREAVDRWGMPEVHLTGNALYPADALTRAPSILQCLGPTDATNCPWGKGGWAWDLFCAHEIVPETAETNLIQQVWHGDPWTVNNLSRLTPDCALAHRSKNGSLIYALAERDHPDFFNTLPKPTRYFSLTSNKPRIELAGHTFSFAPILRDTGARIISLWEPTNARDEAILLAHVGTAGLLEITPDEARQLRKQAVTANLD